jgi:hypothetical protein
LNCVRYRRNLYRGFWDIFHCCCYGY